MLVVGGRETASRTVAVRERRRGDLGVMPLDQAIARFAQEIATKALPDPGDSRN
jgi:threonyl-tRNA synthetase